VRQMDLLGTSAPIVAYIDGGARGNPGPAGYGVRIEGADGELLAELYGALGVTTNNVAEYRGLLAALAWAEEHGHPRVQVRSDSLLLVKQMRGEYRVRHERLQPLYEEARGRIRRLGHVGFTHIPRARNREADRLANRAMDEAGQA
jgi:ribonuclease HI